MISAAAPFFYIGLFFTAPFFISVLFSKSKLVKAAKHIVRVGMEYKIHTVDTGLFCHILPKRERFITKRNPIVSTIPIGIARNVTPARSNRPASR